MQDTQQNVLTVGDKLLEKITSRQIYNLFLEKDQYEIPTIRVSKYVAIPRGESMIEKIFNRCHRNTVDVSSKAFQFRFLNDILVDNYWLTKWKILENNACSFCQENEENIFHLYWECNITSRFWIDFNAWIRSFSENGITVEEVFYGTEDKLLHTLIILAKRLIYESRKKQ